MASIRILFWQNFIMIELCLGILPYNAMRNLALNFALNCVDKILR
ncbi:hypothetical protein CAMGR0001_1111 [Campylobacter gracilis RM3268]|uniref:Uncharacterized protein n=1 Tax=Campylobacter gracilis RM3268 TaxID=553220 RepID=C8PIR2_9BACT|nr:hypothetical protein CAMGR0001_1111 [Campylobacter gracilis RM3268]